MKKSARRSVIGLLTVVVTVLAGASAGCGYSLAGRGSYLPSYIKVVAIPTLENRTPYSRVETILTDKIRGEFIGKNKYTIINEAAGADAVVRGEIIAFNAQTAGLNEQQLSSRYLVTVVLKVSFIETKTNAVLWSNDALTFRDEYQFSSAGGVNGSTLVDQQPTTVDRIAADAARTIVTAIVEAF
jgi:hypothetical protein